MDVSLDGSGRRRIDADAVAPGAIETEPALLLHPRGSPWRERMLSEIPTSARAGARPRPASSSTSPRRLADGAVCVGEDGVRVTRL